MDHQPLGASPMALTSANDPKAPLEKNVTTYLELGFEMLQDRRRMLGKSPAITEHDRQRISTQMELAAEPWAAVHQLLIDDPELVQALDDLWPHMIPYLIKGNEVSPIQHIPYVVQFMAQIGLVELTPLELKRGVLAALMHDIGIGDCALPKISEASILRAAPDEKEKLRRDGIASRLEHMKLGVEIARKLLGDYRRYHPGFLTDEDLEVILDVIGSHDFSKIPLMEEFVDPKWLLRSDRRDWLKQCHWEADALWMLTAAGIQVDLEREKEQNTAENRRAKFVFNLGLHREIISLYAKAYSSSEMQDFGFREGLLYRSATGYSIAKRLEQESISNYTQDSN